MQSLTEKDDRCTFDGMGPCAASVAMEAEQREAVEAVFAELEAAAHLAAERLDALGALNRISPAYNGPFGFVPARQVKLPDIAVDLASDVRAATVPFLVSDLRKAFEQ